jgi:hypothetical protein
MRLFRLLLAALCLIVLGVTTTPAQAATLNASAPIWSNRVADTLSNQLNRQDCLDNAQAKFSLSIRGAATGTFEIWSGSGCDQAANRSNTSTTKTCALVKGGLQPLDQEVTISFRDMVKTYGDNSDATEATCDLPQTAGLLTRTLYFVVSDPNTLAPIVSYSWKFTYDIQAPPPPSDVTAEAGDETLVTKFTAPTGQTNLKSYHFYCAEPNQAPEVAAGGNGGTAGTAGTDSGGSAGMDVGGSGGTDSAGMAGSDGSADTAGSAGSTTIDPNCYSSILIPNQPPPAGAIDCGTILAQGASGGETSPVLENNSPWVVAVATEDSVKNIGVLSNLACATPKDITGFFEAYREAGGKAGGGYCSFAPATNGSLAFALVTAFAAFAWVRRRR